jgi:hypothetical protein
MSQAQAGQSNAPAVSNNLALAVLKGRITKQRRIKTQSGTLFFTLVKLPSPDEYTSPQTVELRSSARLGQDGDDWQGRVRIGGYGRSYSVVDPETGEKVPVATADITLTVQE